MSPQEREQWEPLATQILLIAVLCAPLIGYALFRLTRGVVYGRGTAALCAACVTVFLLAAGIVAHSILFI